MPIVFGAIAPHGFPIIPHLSEDAEGALATREAMQELGRRCVEAGVESIVIAGPHGVRVDGAVCLADVSRGAGTLIWQGRRVEMNVPVDMALTDRVARVGQEAGIPIARAGYAGNRRDQSRIPLDWGVMTPLWFLGHGRHLEGYGDVLADPPEVDEGPPAVIITPSRSLPRQTLVAFGRAVAEAAATDERRIAFVASCDWGHRHREDGPYGYHEASARVDRMVVEAIERDDLGALMAITDEDAENAAIDGLWQALMLAGVLERVPMRGQLLCYEAPSYYGMIVAAYTPIAA
ncbi:MAG TPA: aromatic ring-opening dioxygenase subunit LigB [Thermomicrobiales bacterium]